jgi:ribosome-binding factor A
MKQFKRKDRVARLVVEILAELVAREVHDPRVAGCTITGADLGDDLRLATVTYQVLAPSTPEGVQGGLDSARGFLRRELGSRLQLKFTPDIRFRYDSSLDQQQRIEDILRGIGKEDS